MDKILQRKLVKLSLTNHFYTKKQSKNPSLKETCANDATVNTGACLPPYFSFISNPFDCEYKRYEYKYFILNFGFKPAQRDSPKRTVALIKRFVYTE